MDSKPKTIQQRVCTFITRNHLLPSPTTPNFSVVVGLSGGADSVALVHILHSLGYKLQLTHCHFGLREDEADRDADFCAAYARQLGLPLRTVCFDTQSELRRRPQSVETLCRKLRYHWWEREYLKPAERYGDGIAEIRLCVGHHQDDVIETALFRLMRGTGIRGLMGIPARNGWIARPLMCLSHREIVGYLKACRLPYVTDSTNLENDCVRNKIRNLLLPLMEQINPNARRGIAKTLYQLADTQYFATLGIEIALYEEASTFSYDGYTFTTVPRRAVEQNDRTQAILYECLKNFLKHPMRLIPDIVRCLDAGAKNRVFRTNDTYICLTETHLVFTPNGNPIAPPFQWSPGEDEEKEPPYFQIHIEDRRGPCVFSDDENHACLDLLKMVYPLHFRHWQEGDRIRPMGMKNYKLVSDLFTDAHYSPLQKAQAWVVTDARGRIAWVSGLRLSGDFCVDSSTRRMLHIHHMPCPRMPQ